MNNITPIERTRTLTVTHCPAQTYDTPQTYDMPQASVFEHDDPRDVSFFDPLEVMKAPVYTQVLRNDEIIPRAACLKYRSTGQLAYDQCVSTSYTLQNHTDLFADHYKVLQLSNLDLSNVLVRDEYTNGGRKAKRSIFFKDCEVDLGNGDTVTARCDMLNTVDMTGSFQMFAGAYRSFCENSMVFGGEKAFYTKRKHTQHFDASRLLKTANSVFTTFTENIERFFEWKNTPVADAQAAQIIRYFLSQDLLNPKKIKRGIQAGELSEVAELRTKQIEDQISTLDSKPFHAMMNLWEMYSAPYGSKFGQGVGQNKWALYNVFTHWATHTHDAREIVNDKGETRVHSFGRKSPNMMESKFGGYTMDEQERRSEKLFFLFQIPQWNALGNQSLAIN